VEEGHLSHKSTREHLHLPALRTGAVRHRGVGRQGLSWCGPWAWSTCTTRMPPAWFDVVMGMGRLEVDLVLDSGADKYQHMDVQAMHPPDRFLESGTRYRREEWPERGALGEDISCLGMAWIGSGTWMA
jgi:hypothetical protein